MWSCTFGGVWCNQFTLNHNPERLDRQEGRFTVEVKHSLNARVALGHASLMLQQNGNTADEKWLLNMDN